MDTVNKYDLIEKLKNRKIAIYGTGFIAMIYYDLLVKNGLEKNIECFIVSQTKAEKKEVNGISVSSIDRFENGENLIICIAVHQVNKNEIEENLNRRNITNYIWIYPYLFELFYGTAIKKEIYVPVDTIIQQCSDYRIAIKYLAIENYFGKNTCGYEIYRKSQELFGGKITAEKKRKKFCEMIKEWETKGYQTNFPILIDENYKMIDGAHRVTLAKYFKVEQVVCNVFKSESDYYHRIGSGALMTKQKVMESDFTKEEVELIENTYQRIKGQAVKG